ncbi:FecCD family ABC transporter permease [Herpetosiphon sp. NSE202]|uniref:FecCD family ABC transporter permease n=1 Tax=Herpetosiphon sp. NSE202 TaxID=3351349 RepID=UPI00363531A2
MRTSARPIRALVMALLLGIALVGVGMLALMLGVTPIPAADVWSILLTGEGERVPTLVIQTLRLPRFILGMLAGAALGLVGALLQSALDNPLAEPGLLGVSSGASLVVAIVIVFDLSLPFGMLPALALAGGLAAGLLILLATRLTRDPVRTILIGAAISALLSAMITCVVVLGEPNEIQVLYSFLIGSLTGRDWDAVRMVLPWLALGIPASLLFARALNLLQLGDELAEGLGLPVFRTRTILLILSSAMMAAVVSACGPISFIALIAPHIVRRILRTSDARPVLPLSAMLGALLLTAADLLAREIFSPAELPVGLITVVMGAPLALVLLRRTLTARQATEEGAS